MKEKILNVKNILKIILILFILFNMAKSCSYANSVDLSNYDTYNYNGDIMDFFKQCFNYVTNYELDGEWTINGTTTQTNFNDMLDKIADDNCQFITFAINEGANTTTYYNGRFLSINFYKTPPTNGEYYHVSAIYRKTNDNKIALSKATPGTSNITITGNLTGNQTQLYLINKNNSNIRANQLWYKSKSNNDTIQANLSFRPLYDYIKTIANKQFYISEWTLGFSYIELGELENWENVANLKGEIYKWTSNTSYEYIGDIRILVDGRTQIQTNNIYYNQGYLIRFTYGEGESTGYYNYYFVPYGGNSGDFSGELIYQPSDPNEYKPITNTINENNDMWKDIYESLFIMDSGDVQQLKNRISGELMEVIDGKNDYTEEYELLDTLNNTRPTDFIISWQAVQYENQNFIPSGEINFNNIVTEWRLTEVHRVLRIIVVGALAFVGARALWKCITITLGIGMEMYDENKEEENIVTEIDEDTGRTTQYTNTTRGNRTRVNIKDKTIEKPRRRIGF